LAAGWRRLRHRGGNRDRMAQAGRGLGPIATASTRCVPTKLDGGAIPASSPFPPAIAWGGGLVEAWRAARTALGVERGTVTPAPRRAAANDSAATIRASCRQPRTLPSANVPSRRRSGRTPPASTGHSSVQRRRHSAGHCPRPRRV